jgi:hypothetical protein
MLSLTLRMPLDLLSPRLFQACTSGEHFNGVELVTRDPSLATGTPRPFSSFKMKLAFVSRISWELSSNSTAEVVELIYGLNQFTYNRIGATGNVVSTTIAHWDVILENGGPGPFPGSPAPTLSYPANQKVARNGSGVIQPANGPTSLDPLLPLTIINLGGYTGQAQIDPITGALMLQNAAPLGGPFNIQVRATDIFGVGTTVTAPIIVSTQPQFLRIQSIGTNVVLQLSGTASRSYQMQSATTVTGAWANTGSPLTIDPSGQLVRFTNGRGSNSLFYRAVETP